VVAELLVLNSEESPWSDMVLIPKYKVCYFVVIQTRSTSVQKVPNVSKEAAVSVPNSRTGAAAAAADRTLRSAKPPPSASRQQVHSFPITVV